MKKYIFLCLLFLLLIDSACSRMDITPGQADAIGQMFPVSFTAEHIQKDVTKTSLEGTSLSWQEDDRIGIFVSDDIQSNMSFRHTGGGGFYGEFVTRGVVKDDAKFCSYYPYSYKNSFIGTTLTSVLPECQVAPFDPSADFIVSDAIVADYDEEQMPSLLFKFNNHLFSIVKITVTNSDPALKDEKLYGVQLRSEGSVLSGYFSTELTDGKDADAEFNGQTISRVSVDFSEEMRPTLGINVNHTIYAVVAAGTLDGITVTVKTENYRASVSSAKTFTLKKSCVTALPAFDVASLKKEKRVRTISYWGDSICSEVLCSYLQTLLGADWIVYRAGVAGDNAAAIAGRQGGIPMCIGAGDGFLLPSNHNEKVAFQGLYSTVSKDGSPDPGLYKISHAWWFKSGYEPRINPCVISFTDGGGHLTEVECTITFDQEADLHYIQRTADGETVSVPALATVTSYGATAFRETDVVACFMGVNAQPKDTLLSDWYDRMIDYAVSDKFIVVGYHRSYYRGHNYWTQSYHDFFSNKYGDRFLDLRLVGNTNVDHLLIKSGTYHNLSQKTQTDIDLINQGEWPAVWYVDFENDIHPNRYGYQAYAVMVYEKMRELGYLD